MQQLTSSLPTVRILNGQDLDLLTQLAQQTTYAPGSCLLKAGEETDRIFLCLTGRLATVFPASGSDPAVSLAIGELAGATALLNDQPVPTTIVAEASSDVLVISKAKLKLELDNDREFAARFYQLFATNLSEYLRELSKLMASRQVQEGEPLRKVLLVFATLDDSDVAWMIEHGKSEKSATGAVLIQQDQLVPAVYLLLDGMLGVYIAIAGQEREVAKRVKGDILGEMSFVDGGVASATVKALDNTWVLTISQAQLAAKLQEDGAFAGRFYRAIAQVLSNRCQDLLIRGSIAASQVAPTADSRELEEDELDLDILDGTAIAGTRFDWMIQRLRR
jgi:bacteriocin-type transport-associated protein